MSLSFRVLTDELAASQELLAHTSALKTENEVLRGDTSEALQQILSALQSLQLPRAAVAAAPSGTIATVKKKGR